MTNSHLVATLRLHLQAAAFPPWVEEYRFHPERRWRFDLALVANRLGRDAVIIELNPDYAELARVRLIDDAPMFASVEVAQ